MGEFCPAAMAAFKFLIKRSPRMVLALMGTIQMSSAVEVVRHAEGVAAAEIAFKSEIYLAGNRRKTKFLACGYPKGWKASGKPAVM